MAQQPAAARPLHRRWEDLADRCHALAFDAQEPCRSAREVERRVAEGEAIAKEARAIVRG